MLLLYESRNNLAVLNVERRSAWRPAPLAKAPKTIDLTLMALAVLLGLSVKTAATYKTWKGVLSMRDPLRCSARHKTKLNEKRPS